MLQMLSSIPLAQYSLQAISQNVIKHDTSAKDGYQSMGEEGIDNKDV